MPPHPNTHIQNKKQAARSTYTDMRAQEAVSILSGSASPQQLSDALDALRLLVEPIDAANGARG